MRSLVARVPVWLSLALSPALALAQQAKPGSLPAAPEAKAPPKADKPAAPKEKPNPAPRPIPTAAKS
ncbi:MAG TPA: hypothetical protein VEQ58_00430, partial [Polyangiaceae bacterium]|nr:hypothetical protein [Polyangiaceae bacterium]